ncbi:MAG TPA: hypothetical protein VHM92_09045 [Allosphingosinicella sp.]|nr:hypothetical protein [Allosphingosinicella sp.]
MKRLIPQARRHGNPYLRLTVPVGRRYHSLQIRTDEKHELREFSRFQLPFVRAAP